jgi:hypothetical protein
VAYWPGSLSIAKQQAAIAQQQAELATIRLQHELYDRRFTIFEAARNFLVHQIYVYGNVSDESYKSYFKGTADALFLLDDTVADYLEDIRTKGLRLKWLNEKIRSIEAGDERIKATADENEMLNWFYDQEEGLIEKFKPFLMIRADEKARPRDRSLHAAAERKKAPISQPGPRTKRGRWG